MRRDPAAGYANYTLPTASHELAFTLKGALRLEMMRSSEEAYRKYRRLFGSNTKAKDLSAWRSRVNVAAYDTGPAAAAAARCMLLPDPPVDPAGFLERVTAIPGPVVLLQVNDVYLDVARTVLFSQLLAQFLLRESQLLRFDAMLRVLPVCNEVT